VVGFSRQVPWLTVGDSNSYAINFEQKKQNDPISSSCNAKELSF